MDNTVNFRQKNPQMSERLSLESLHLFSPFTETGNDVVTQASRDLVLSCIKSDPRVHDVFFPSFVASGLQDSLDLRAFPMGPLAVTFVAEAMANIKDSFKFHSTVNKGAVDHALRDIYDSLQWKKFGFQVYTLVYPEVVKDSKTGVSMKDYMGEEGCIWAERLISLIQEPAWTRSVQRSMIRGRYCEEEYNRDMNALLVKLHLLDPQAVMPAYQYLLSQKALPAVNLELATRNYLGGPLDWRLIQFEVENAERRPSTPLGLSRLSLDSQMDVFHGTAVDDFVVTECRNLGLWSGLRPENAKTSKPSDKCFVM